MRRLEDTRDTVTVDFSQGEDLKTPCDEVIGDPGLLLLWYSAVLRNGASRLIAFMTIGFLCDLGMLCGESPGPPTRRISA
jgi:hypothetical protein